ncbi:MAG: hypothetical protein ACYC3W_10915 [Candidatus Nanopelagicales bacterium]
MIPNDDIVKLRRSRLADAIAEKSNGSAVQFAALVNRQPSQINDMLHGRKAFGEKVTRYLEKACGFPPGWFDANRPVDRESEVQLKNLANRQEIIALLAYVEVTDFLADRLKKVLLGKHDEQ